VCFIAFNSSFMCLVPLLSWLIGTSYWAQVGVSSYLFMGLEPRSLVHGVVSPDYSVYTIGVFYTDFIFILKSHLNMT
jgi:hypothetical protein